MLESLHFPAEMHFTTVEELISLMPTTKTATHLIDVRTLHSMISRIRSRLIQNIRWRLAELHPIPFESQITHPRDIISIIILHKKRQILNLAKKCSLDLDILNLWGLREAEFLRGSQVRCSWEVDVVAVYEDFEGLGRWRWVWGAN